MLRAILSWLVAGVMAVLSFFGGLFGIGGGDKPEATVPQPTTAIVQPTEAPTTTQPTTLPASQTFSFTVESLQELGLTPHTLTMHSTDSIGREFTRVYTGVIVKEVLNAMGADISRLNSGSTLRVTASDGANLTYDYSVIISDLTLLAWDMDGSAQNPPRFAPGSTTGVNHALFVQRVVSLTVNY